MKQIRRKGIVWMLVFAMIVGNILPSGFTTASATQKSGAETEASEQESGLDSRASPRIVPDGSMEAGQENSTAAESGERRSVLAALKEKQEGLERRENMADQSKGHQRRGQEL